MYPVARLAWQLWRHRADPPLPLLGTHESRHRCWPWDLDVFLELNNGRTLTLYDLGRIPWFRRIGLDRVLRREGALAPPRPRLRAADDADPGARLGRAVLL
jgi:hypothetical protein